MKWWHFLPMTTRHMCSCIHIQIHAYIHICDDETFELECMWVVCRMFVKWHFYSCGRSVSWLVCWLVAAVISGCTRSCLKVRTCRFPAKTEHKTSPTNRGHWTKVIIKTKRIANIHFTFVWWRMYKRLWNVWWWTYNARANMQLYNSMNKKCLSTLMHDVEL